MSFQTNIAGCPPCNNFTFTTTSVSANSVSCDNLSATNASIVNLTTTTFSPVNINTSNIIADSITTGYLSAANISTTIINSSLTTSAELIATSGTINTFYSGFIESVGALITDINTDDLTAGHIHVSNISLDGTLGGHTANLVQLNAQNIAAIVTDSFYVNASQINVVETINVCTINCSNVSASGNISATTFTGRIDGNLAAGSGIALTQVGNITTITNTGIVTDPLTIGTINVTNLSADHIHVSNISLDGTIGGSTANIAVGNIPTVNSSTVNASTVDTSLIYIDDTNTGDTTSLARTNNILTLVGTTLNSSIDINFFLSNPATRFPIMTLNGNLDAVDINGDLRVTGTIDGDISPNLVAGTGISLSTVAGITTIGNTAQTSDPLNLSTLNASTINSSNISNSSSITTGSLTGDISSNLAAAAGITLSTVNGLTTISSNALSQSTQYAFQATSNLNNNQTVGAGTLLYYNVIELETTPVFGAGYDTGGQRYYIPPGAGGTWTFGFKAFINTTPTNFRIGIYKNGSLIAQGGYSSETTESFDVVCQANPGEYFWVMGVSGGASVYMAATHSWFYGYRLEAVNNSVSITTNLTVADLNATNVGAALVAAADVIASTATAGTTNTSTLNASTINGDIGGNLAAGTNIALNTAGGITTISTITPGLTHPLNISDINVSVVANISTANISTLTVQAQLTAGNSSFSNISASGDITATTLTADISPNLVAGTDIALNTVAGITTINFTGGTADPLNLSTLNVSIINNSTINTSHADMVNASVSQTLEFAAGSTLKMDNSAGDSVFLYNDSTRFNYGTLSGNTADINFGSGYNASTIQITGGNVVNMENAAGVNISNVSINNASITTADIVNLSSPLVGKSRFYSRRQTTSQSPGNTNLNYYSNYNLLVSDNPHVTWATPNNATGGVNTGFIIQTAGWYRIEYTFNGHSVSYNNRIGWFTRLYKNGVTFDADQYVVFMYTRGDNSFTCQWATGNTFCIVTLAVGDYIHTRTNIGKNSALHNNDWSGVEAAWGGTCQFEYLGT